jgi:hypothetical protein
MITVAVDECTIKPSSKLHLGPELGLLRNTYNLIIDTLTYVPVS